MPPQDPKKFVADLELAYPKFGIDSLEPQNALETALQSGEDEKAESYIDNKSLVSFVSNVSGQNRQDVLNSILLAQLVADFKFPSKTNLTDGELIKWYEEFIKVLEGVGWTIEERESSEFQSGQSIFEMENVILDILGAAIGGSYLAIIVKTLEAFKSLSDTDNKILAFERNTHSISNGNFQIGLANETNGVVSLSLSAFTLFTSKKIKKILFFKSAKDETKLRFYTMKYTLGSEIYSLVRNDILKKLGEKVTTFIAELPI